MIIFNTHKDERVVSVEHIPEASDGGPESVDAENGESE